MTSAGRRRAGVFRASSGISTLPSGAIRSGTSRRQGRGTIVRGISRNRSYNSYCGRGQSPAYPQKPAMVISSVGPPLCPIRLVNRVVAWITLSMRSGAMPDRSTTRLSEHRAWISVGFVTRSLDAVGSDFRLGRSRAEHGACLNRCAVPTRGAPCRPSPYRPARLDWPRHCAHR
jgi:hypothetical protein